MESDWRFAQAVLLALAVGTAPCLAQDIIDHNINTGKTTPEIPTLHLDAPISAVTLQFSGEPRPQNQRTKEFFIIGQPNLPNYVRVEGDPSAVTHGTTSSPISSLGRQHSISFRPCSQESFKDENIRTHAPGVRPSGIPRTGRTWPSPSPITEKFCPFAVADERWRGAWTIFTNDRSVAFSARAYFYKFSNGARQGHGDSVKQGNLIGTYTVPILVRRAPFILNFSGGFAGFDERGERYALRKIDGNDAERNLVALDDSSHPYQLALFAHSTFVKAPAVHITVGVGADVPVKDLSFMLGLSLSARTQTILDDFYLTLGASYAPVDRLKANFRGLPTVPATTRDSDLLEKEHEVGAFIAISYGFAGNKNKFKGVFSGSGK